MDERTFIWGGAVSLTRFYLQPRNVVTVRQQEIELGVIYNFNLIGEVGDGQGFIVRESRAINQETDPTFENLLYVDLVTNEVLILLEGEHIEETLVLPGSSLIWLTFKGSEEGMILEAPSGEVVAGPAVELHIPSADEIQYAPVWRTLIPRQYIREMKIRSRSPDRHLITGYQRDEVVVWDVETGDFTPVAPDLEGEKIFLGWVPDPSAYDGLIPGP